MGFRVLSDVMDDWFGSVSGTSDWTAWQLVARAAVVYFLGLVLVRVGKSRLIAQATPIDFILCVMIGAILSSSIIGRFSIAAGLIASSTLVFLHWLTTWVSCRSHQFGNIVHGHAKILVEDGKLNTENLRSSHLSEHDLKEGLRLNANLDDVSEVKLAVKERCGRIGVVKRTRIAEIAVKDGVQVIRIVD